MPSIKYVLDTNSNKVYSEDILSETVAVDPNHWTTDIENLQAQVVTLQAQIDDINNNQIPAKQAEQADFFTQFPQFNPAIITN